MDHGCAPGTRTPEAGDLSACDEVELIRGFKGLNFVGGNVVEVASAYGPITNTAQDGAQMLFEIQSLMKFSPSLPDK